jgi:hypothetical protein
MPDDDAPSAFSDSPPVMSTNVDQKVLDHWDDTWSDILPDSHEEEPPKAPSKPKEPESPKAETEPHEAPEQHKEVEPPPPKPKRKLETTAKAPSNDELDEILDGPKPLKTEADPTTEPDPLDALDLPPGAAPKQRSQFAELRETTKKFRDQAKTLQKLTPLLQEFGIGELPETPAEIEQTLEEFATKVRAAKSSGATIPADVSAELDTFRKLSRNSSLEKSLTFDRGYIQPLRNAYRDVIEDFAASIPSNSPQQMAQWAQDLVTRYGPEQLNAGWLREHFGYISDDLARQRIASKVGNMLTLQQQHDRVKADVVGDGDVYSQWRRIEEQQKQQEQEHFNRQWQDRVFNKTRARVDSDPEFKEAKELRDRAAQPNASEEDKRAWNQVDREFSKKLTEIASGDPDLAADYAMENMFLKKKLPQLQKELDEANRRIERLTGQVTTKRKISDVPLRNGHGAKAAPPERKKLGGKIDFSSLGG